jgi:hypothetical protein
MRKSCAVFIFAALFLCEIAPAQETGGVGIGIIAGEPTGLSVKKWIDDNRAIDTAAAWTFEKDTSFTLYADYLLHSYDWFEDRTRVKRGKLPLYYGMGLRIAFGDETKMGMRIPLGINYIFKKERVDFFIGIAPDLNLVPSTSLNMSGGLGVRYYIR